MHETHKNVMIFKNNVLDYYITYRKEVNVTSLLVIA